MKVIFLILVALAIYSEAKIWTAQNTLSTLLPPPLQAGGLDKYDVIFLGGSGAGISAGLLARYTKLNILVIDDGETISFNCSNDNPYRGVCPGYEYAGSVDQLNGYFQPGIEMHEIIKPSPSIQADGSLSHGDLWRKVRGGDPRLSHYAIELGSSEVQRREMFEPLGQPQEWSVDYVWGHATDMIFNFFGPNIRQNHGNKGDIIVQQSPPNTTWEQTWREACTAYTGYRNEYDPNTITGAIETCMAEPSNIKFNGERSIPENEYLIPEAEINNRLTFVRDTKVNKVLFSTYYGKLEAVGFQGTFAGKAFSVKYSDFARDGCKDKCKQTIVVNMGVYHTPQILMISGLGPKDELKRRGITVLKDLPAMGANLRESLVSFISYFSNATASDIGQTSTGRAAARPGAFVSLVSEGGQPYYDDMMLLWTPSNFGTAQSPFVVGFALAFELLPQSVGSIRLATANPEDAPIIDYGWSVASNTMKQVRAFRMLRKIIDSGVKQRFNLFESFPGESAVTDAELIEASRLGGQAVLHAAGTTRMTNGDSVNGVVDLDFNVYGVKGLKIAGTSIMPYCPGAGGQTWSWISHFNLQNKIREEHGYSPI